LLGSARSSAFRRPTVPSRSANDQTSQTTESYLIDMNGVLVHNEQLIPDADQFIAWLKATGRGHWAMRRMIARHTCRAPHLPDRGPSLHARTVLGQVRRSRWRRS
jgi:hypothetical protein